MAEKSEAGPSRIEEILTDAQAKICNKSLDALDSVQVSDGTLPTARLLSLIRLTERLEYVGLREQRWRWRSGRPWIVNLIDPSAHCLIPEVTTVVRNGKAGVVPLYVARGLQNQLQWLPAQVAVDWRGGNVEILSYVNNLHPVRYAEMYRSIKEIIGESVPLFERVLSDLAGDSEPVSLGGRELQMIVGMSNLYLSPKGSLFPGTNWHSDGLPHEHVVATAIFSYQSSNTTPLRFGFRVKLSEDNYLDVGSRVSKPNRLLVFPNTYQYIIRPFKICDKLRSGFQKLLTILLVDPAQKIISTDCVPPQQKEWYEKEGWEQSGLDSDYDGELRKLYAMELMELGRPIEPETAKRFCVKSELLRDKLYK